MPLVSFIISTFNRRDALLQTLRVLAGSASGSNPSETIVIDNASQDGSADAVAREFPAVRLLRQNVNRGPCAKNLGLPLARGEFVVFLDDDSFPEAGSIDRMVNYFAAQPRLGAAAFDVQLPGGGRECSAYPEVFAGCGVGLRATAIAQVGGLPEDFFMQAEEYDLSLRLLDAGWQVRRFEDLCVRHLKTPQARFPARTMRLDVRNNLTLIGRYFPDQWVRPFAVDWARRYRMIATANGATWAYYKGLAEGLLRLSLRAGRRPISAAAFETFAKIEQIENLMTAMTRQTGASRILLIDLGKNILPYWLAARKCGLKVVAIADAKLGGRGFRYRGVPILDDLDAARLSFDAGIVSNLSPVHVLPRRDEWRQRTNQPIFDLFTDFSQPAAEKNEDLTLRSAA
jgi:GT2 family glycosyltransferase